MGQISNFKNRFWGAAEILRGSPYVQHIYLGNYSFAAVFVHGSKVYVMLVEDHVKRIRLFLARVLYKLVRGVIEKDYRKAIYKFISKCIRKSCGAEEDPIEKYKMLSEIEFMVGEYAPHFKFAAAFDVDEKNISEEELKKFITGIHALIDSQEGDVRSRISGLLHRYAIVRDGVVEIYDYDEVDEEMEKLVIKFEDINRSLTAEEYVDVVEEYYGNKNQKRKFKNFKRGAET